MEVELRMIASSGGAVLAIFQLTFSDLDRNHVVGEMYRKPRHKRKMCSSQVDDVASTS